MAQTCPILLMTRPAPDSRRFVEDVRAMVDVSFRAVISPLLGISYREPPDGLDQYAGVVLTSRHAVAALQASGAACGGLAFAVGDATRDAAQTAGFSVHSADGDADALIALIRDSKVKGPLIHLRGVHSRGDIAARLTAAAIETDESVIYDQPELPLNADAMQAIEGEQPVVAPLFSPRTAALLAAYGVKAPLSVAAMSESVAKAAAPLHIRHERRAPRPALIEMQSLTAELLREASRL